VRKESDTIIAEIGSAKKLILAARAGG